MLFDATCRQLAAERMDQPNLDAAEHRRALAGLRRINALSRTAAYLQQTIENRIARAGFDYGHPLRILDVACGGGEVLAELGRRLHGAGWPVLLHACDVSPLALDQTRRRVAATGFDVASFRHDLLKEPLPGEFDVVICTLFLHHLDERDALRLLQRIDAAARHLAVVDDLARTRGGWWLARLATRLVSRSAVVHADGPQSVAAAFTPAEALELARRAGLRGLSLSRHWPHRWLLSWQPGLPPPLNS